VRRSAPRGLLFPFVLLVAAAPLAGQQTLTVFAAASLTEAFSALGARFEAEHPGTAVRFNFAGSQILVTQIEQGARADVFASADQRWMRYAADRGLLVGGAAVFARNRLVVLIPRSNPGRVQRLQDLGRPGVKVVLAGRQVPAGGYSREALRRLGEAPGFPADFDVRVQANLVSEEENVRAVAAKVQLAEADAGIVYRTDVTRDVASRVLQLEIPEPYGPIAEYPVAAVVDGQVELARTFIDLVLSPSGQAVLAERGFMAAGGTTPR
jgi:molybdate transport system substrate-binding protein